EVGDGREAGDVADRVDDGGVCRYGQVGEVVEAGRVGLVPRQVGEADVAAVQGDGADADGVEGGSADDEVRSGLPEVAVLDVVAAVVVGIGLRHVRLQAASGPRPRPPDGPGMTGRVKSGG